MPGSPEMRSVLFRASRRPQIGGRRLSPLPRSPCPGPSPQARGSQDFLKGRVSQDLFYGTRRCRDGESHPGRWSSGSGHDRSALGSARARSAGCHTTSGVKRADHQALRLRRLSVCRGAKILDPARPPVQAEERAEGGDEWAFFVLTSRSLNRLRDSRSMCSDGRKWCQEGG